MLDARLSGTQNVFSLASSNTSPPNTPVPCESTPTSKIQGRVEELHSEVNPWRIASSAGLFPMSASAAADADPLRRAGGRDGAPREAGAALQRPHRAAGRRAQVVDVAPGNERLAEDALWDAIRRPED